MFNRTDRSAAIAAEKQRRAALTAKRGEAARLALDVEQREEEESRRLPLLRAVHDRLVTRRRVLAERQHAAALARVVGEAAGAHGLDDLEAIVTDVVELAALEAALYSRIGRTPSGVALSLLSDLEREGALDLDEPHLARVRVFGRMGIGDATSPGSAWTLWRDLVHLASGRAPTSASAMRLVGLVSAPAPAADEFLVDGLVDALVDAGAAEALLAELPQHQERFSYIRARTRPSSLTDDEVEALGWASEARRRAFLEGAPLRPSPEDDLLVLDHLRSGRYGEASKVAGSEHVGVGVRDLVRDLQALTQGRSDAREWHDDRSLWDLLAQATPRGHEWSEPSNFTEWHTVRSIMTMLHGGDVTQAGAAIERGLRDTPSSAFAAELLNLDVYVAGLLGRAQNARSRFARLRQLRRGTQLLEQNGRALALLGTGRSSGFVNPYVTLGVAHGSTDWTTSWRASSLAATKNRDTERRIQLNRAKVVLESADLEILDYYRVPLDETLLEIPRAQSGMLRPAPSALPAWTSGISDRMVVSWSDRAAREAMEQLFFASPRLLTRARPLPTEELPDHG